MQDINIFQQNLKKIGPDSIIRLLADVVLEKLENVKNFNVNETYNKGDIIFKYDEATQKNKILICQDDNVKGTFQQETWNNFSILDPSFGTKAKLLESTYTAVVDDETTCPINQSLFNKEKDDLVVNHSVRGLVDSSNYTISEDSLTVQLTTFSLFEGEKLTFYVLKNM